MLLYLAKYRDSDFLLHFKDEQDENEMVSLGLIKSSSREQSLGSVRAADGRLLTAGSPLPADQLDHVSDGRTGTCEYEAGQPDGISSH